MLFFGRGDGLCRRRHFRLFRLIYAKEVKALFRLGLFGQLTLLAMYGQCRVACDTRTLIWAKDNKSDVALFRVVKDRKVGYIDFTGRLVIPHQFDLTFNYLWDFAEGLAPVQLGQKWGFINPKGEFAIPPNFEWVTPFSEGRALVRVGIGGPPFKIGFIDRNGKFVGEPNLNGAAGPFAEGYAAVELPHNKWGYIDSSCKMVIEPRFAWARRFSEGLARVIEKGGCEVLENTCDCMDLPADHREPAAKPNTPLPACRFSYIDKSGTTILSGYQNAQEFSEGFAAVRTSRLWGFIRQDGSKAIPEQFQSVKPFHDGLAAVRMDNKWGFIDSTGRMVIKPQFDNTEGFSDGLGLVWTHGRSAFINKTGDQLFGRTYSLAAPFALGLAHVALGERQEGRWAYINHAGVSVYEYSARQ